MCTNFGFEVSRHIVCDEDLVCESTEHGLRFSVQQMVFQRCHSIHDTMQLLRAIAHTISEHRDKTGMDRDEVIKTTLLRGAMDVESGGDPQTQGRAQV